MQTPRKPTEPSEAATATRQRRDAVASLRRVASRYHLQVGSDIVLRGVRAKP